MNHLAVYNRKMFGVDYVQMMFDGIKTIDIKLANRRIAPYKKIKAGDVVYVKESSGPVIGRFMIGKVEYYNLDPGSPEMLEILLKIQKQVGLRDTKHAHSMFGRNRHMKYATVFEIIKPKLLKHPVKISKNSMLTWVVDYTVPLELEREFV